MNAFTAAKRTVLPALAGALLIAAPALADDAGYLGVQLQDLSPAMAKALQLGDRAGVLVSDVVDDSPAEKAGLQDGDVIVAFAGKPLADYESLTAAVRAAKPGDKVDVTVLRDGKQQTIKVELGEREDDFTWTLGKVGEGKFRFQGDDDAMVMLKRMHGDDGEFEVHMEALERGWLGVHIDDLSPQLGDYFGVADGEGALVTEVEDDSPAAKAGLKAGDVIVRIGDDEVEDAAGVHAALSGTDPEDKVDVEFVRQGKKQSKQVTLGEAPEGALSNVYFFGDDEHHIMAPKMMYRHLPHMGKHDVRVMGGPDRRIEIIREMDGAGSDMKELRAELDKMREELDKLRQEMKKN